LTLQTYVLDVHPFNPRIAMSAGYDGRVIIWDVSPFKDPSLCFRPLSYDLLFTQSGDFFLW
jgi:WD40 repeat protein